MKRVLSIIISVLILCSVLSGFDLTVSAVETYVAEVSAENNGLQYIELDDGSLEITGYVGLSSDLVIPDTIDGKTVTRIGTKAFEGSTLTSLVLPDTIVELGAMILSGNTGVKEIKIPDNVTNMQALAGGYKGAFDNSGIEKAVFEDGIKKIPVRAFEGAKKLKEVTLPDSVTEICSYAFKNTSLQSLLLPKNLEKMGATILGDTTGVKEITIPKTVVQMQDLDGGYKGSFNDSGVETVTFESGIDTIPSRALYGAKNLSSVIIPDTVKAIADEVFYSCENLEEIALPDSIKSIDSKTFALTGLRSLILPANIESLGACLLEGNIRVKEITIPKTIVTMQGLAGGYKGTLYGSVVESVVFEEGATVIPERALQNTEKLTKVVIPETVESIKSYAFENSSLTELTLPSKLETIGANILSGNTGVKEITIPKTVTSMKDLAGGYKGSFNGSDIETVVFEEGIKAIPDYALQGATNLKSVTVPMRVKTIGDKAFADCSEDFTIYGYDGSVAHNYALENSVNYVSLGVEPLDTTITLAKSSATVYLTGTTNIKATVKNGVGKTTYHSTNTKVATVNAKGKVTAKKAGIAKITVSNNGVEQTFTVTVKKPTLNKSKITLYKNKTFTLKVTGKVGKAKFTTSNKKVATVNTNGKIVAKKKGKATINVKTNGITLKCKVTVK